MLSTAAAIINKTLWNLRYVDNSVINLNFSHLSVCLLNVPPQRSQMASHNVTFIDVISALYHVASNQTRNAVFMWSVDMCFILPNIYITPLLCRYVVSLHYKVASERFAVFSRIFVGSYIEILEMLQWLFVAFRCSTTLFSHVSFQSSPHSLYIAAVSCLYSWRLWENPDFRFGYSGLLGSVSMSCPKRFYANALSSIYLSFFLHSKNLRAVCNSIFHIMHLEQ